MLTRLFLRAAFAGSEWVLWVLLVISFISVGTIVERWWYYHRTRVDGDRLGRELEKHLRAGDVRSAYTLVEANEAIECEVVAAGLVALSRGYEACSEAMLAAKARVRIIVEARLAILGTIGSNAPYVGLLGTVLGIIKAAHDLTGDTSGAAGAANPSSVMAGVFEALVATAFGLFVAIPAVIAYNVMQRRVRRIMSQVDSLAHLILASVRNERKPAQPAAPGAPRKLPPAEVSAMAASFQDDDGSPISDINIVPLVDVVLVLLIVFMITVPAVVGSASIEVNLPETQHAAMGMSADLPLHLTLRREQDGTLVLYREGTKTSEADLRTMLGAYPAGAEKPETSLAADKSIPYGEVVKIVDMLASLGLTKLSLNTQPVPKTN